MPLDQVVIDQIGPLPITKEFDGKSNAPALLFVSGTAWTPNMANCMIGVDVLLDGKSVGKLELFSTTNAGPRRHSALPAKMIPVQLSIGKHTITLNPLGLDTYTDKYDFFQVVIDY